MIPDKLRMTIVCDHCGATSTVVLSKDDIDSQGLDQVLETNLIDMAWAVRYPFTICAKCVDRIIEEGLRQMEETLFRTSSSSIVEVKE